MIDVISRFFTVGIVLVFSGKLITVPTAKKPSYGRAAAAEELSQDAGSSGLQRALRQQAVVGITARMVGQVARTQGTTKVGLGHRLHCFAIGQYALHGHCAHHPGLFALHKCLGNA